MILSLSLRNIIKSDILRSRSNDLKVPIRVCFVLVLLHYFLHAATGERQALVLLGLQARWSQLGTRDFGAAHDA